MLKWGNEGLPHTIAENAKYKVGDAWVNRIYWHRGRRAPCLPPPNLLSSYQCLDDESVFCYYIALYSVNCRYIRWIRDREDNLMVAMVVQ